MEWCECAIDKMERHLVGWEKCIFLTGSDYLEKDHLIQSTYVFLSLFPILMSVAQGIEKKKY